MAALVRHFADELILFTSESTTPSTTTENAMQTTTTGKTSLTFEIDILNELDI